MTTTLRPFLAPLVMLLAFATQADAAAPPFTAPVLSVTDGDSFTVRHCYGKVRGCVQEKIRLRYVDAPEVAHTKNGINQPGGLEAKDYVTTIAKGKGVTVSVVNRSYDRYVADVTLDGMDLSELVVREGHAMLDMRYKPPQRLLDAQEEAKREKRGIWRLPSLPPIPPKDWRAMTKDEQRRVH